MDTLAKYGFNNNALAAEFFGVSQQTIRNWRNGAPIPRAVIKLLRVRNGFITDHRSPSWEGWQIADDFLYDPQGLKYSAAGVRQLPYLFDKAREVRISKMREKQARKNGLIEFEKRELLELLSRAQNIIEPMITSETEERFAVISAE